MRPTLVSVLPPSAGRPAPIDAGDRIVAFQPRLRRVLRERAARG